MKVTFTHFLTICFCAQTLLAQSPSVPLFGMYEAELQAAGEYANPYTELTAEAVLIPPDGKATRAVPLFWDGGGIWRFRFAPDRPGIWEWSVKSIDQGLNGKSGAFTAVESDRKGGILPMAGSPHHFERQDGSRFWFMGDTAWALYTDNEQEKHDRRAAWRYIEARASQGFNVLHSMLLSEAGWGNRGGPPFHELETERINPAYWQEVDERLAYANRHGIVCGLALAWGDKRKQEPYAWRRFPSVEARKRYARYIAARYGAYDVYFIVSGEWARTRDNATEAQLKQEFVEIGDALEAADAHDRMIAIHPMTSHGSTREFNGAAWMSFGDYQQNYRKLHERIIESRQFHKPVVNSEYGYFLRDQNGDGIPDKANSTSLESMRYATWDIVMAGGYVVTGFGTTYFGGNRDPGPFDVDAAKNRLWEEQMGHMKRLFTSLQWWKLEPRNDLLCCGRPRGKDSTDSGQIAPPKTTYWCLADPGRQYVLYVRGMREPVELSVSGEGRAVKAWQWDPRTGEFNRLNLKIGSRLRYTPPDEQDWIVVLH